MGWRLVASLQALVGCIPSRPGSRPVLRFFLIALIFLPGLWLGYLINVFGVDTPYWDEWDEVPSELLKLQAGNLHLSDLFALHNEHRIFFPRLIMLTLAKLTFWNIRAELFLIWIFAWAASFCLWRLARATGWGGSILGLLLLAAANILLFTPLAFENWLWGFQIGFLQPLACLVLAVWLVSSRGTFLAFFYAITLSFVCTFSIASGFLCWLVTLPLLLLPEGRLQWRTRMPGLACWFVGMVGSVTFYFHGFTPAATQLSLPQILQQPGEATSYILSYLGNPFTRLFDLDSSRVIGAILIFFFVAALTYLARFRKDSPFVARVLPWLMLSSFTLMNAAITMIGRLNYGSSQATGTRYITFSVLLPIGLLFTYAAIYAHAQKQAFRPQNVRIAGRILGSCAVLGVVLNLYGSIFVFDHWTAWKQSRVASQVLLKFVPVIDESDFMVDQHLTCDNYNLLRGEAQKLSDLGYLRPAVVTSHRMSALVDDHAASPDQYGTFEGIDRAPNGQPYAHGWAVLPAEDRPADAILLTYDNNQGEPILFDIAFAGYPHADAPHPNYALAGWIQLFRADRLPPDAQGIRAWAFDLQANRAYPIAGVFHYASPPPAKSG